MSSVISKRSKRSKPKVQGHPENPGDPKPGFLQRRLFQPIRNQLTQGVSARAIGAGIALGAFLLKLNQPVTQAVNFLVYPLQIVLIPVFVRFGEFLFGAEPLSFSIPRMIQQFADSPLDFFSQFKVTFMHCITGWVVAAPFIAALIILMVNPVLRSAAIRLNAKKTQSTSL
jgi:hypothetical protein